MIEAERGGELRRRRSREIKSDSQDDDKHKKMMGNELDCHICPSPQSK